MSFLERKRQLVKDELSHTAAQLIARNGYEETTVEQIVEAAGVSRRTFFRYFRSKEDVIVEVLTAVGEHTRAIVAARPDGEPPGASVRHALEELTRHYLEFPEKALALTRLILGTPALRARYLDRQFEWRQGVAAELLPRCAGDRLRAELISGVGFATLDVAMAGWAEAGDDLPQVLARALELSRLDQL
ncbi:TetR family transcriptional regulator [Nonomuraea sp. NPDC050328]|uniref:TetR family transcriptional regulator n=1 Tax=Nonomuraea sp. NPDC050328 TaxID=3364361 RepID=UPI0037990D98